MMRPTPPRPLVIRCRRPWSGSRRSTAAKKSDALEPFHPERIASRILGMGDVLSLIEQAEATLDKDKADKLAKKLKKGKGFDLEDFRDQLQQMKNMGGLGGLM